MKNYIRYILQAIFGFDLYSFWQSEYIYYIEEPEKQTFILFYFDSFLVRVELSKGVVRLLMWNEISVYRLFLLYLLDNFTTFHHHHFPSSFLDFIHDSFYRIEFDFSFRLTFSCTIFVSFVHWKTMWRRKWREKENCRQWHHSNQIECQDQWIFEQINSMKCDAEWDERKGRNDTRDLCSYVKIVCNRKWICLFDITKSTTDWIKRTSWRQILFVSLSGRFSPNENW